MQISVYRDYLPPEAALAPLPKGGWQIADFRQFDWGIS
jgi:hypothetical protein